MGELKGAVECDHCHKWYRWKQFPRLKTKSKWRLATPSGSMHTCKEYREYSLGLRATNPEMETDPPITSAPEPSNASEYQEVLQNTVQDEITVAVTMPVSSLPEFLKVLYSGYADDTLCTTVKVAIK